MPTNQIKPAEAKLIAEIYKALGLANATSIHRFLTPLFLPAAKRFSELAISFDDDVQALGFREACSRLLPRFTRRIHVKGAELVPSNGPLLILSNHPGTVDGLVIASSLPRSDIKIVVSGVPFIRSLSATANHLIYSSLDTTERMLVIRSTIRHLREGGAVLLFPSGGIDPDPAVMPGALDQVETWSSSLAVILRGVPTTNILIAEVRGVLDKNWARSPVLHLRQGRRNQQRVAEFFQLIQQVIFPGSLLVQPEVTYAQPFTIAADGQSKVLQMIIIRAKQHFQYQSR